MWPDFFSVDLYVLFCLLYGIETNRLQHNNIFQNYYIDYEVKSDTK